MQRSSESIASLAAALAEAQAELVNREKSLVATIRGRDLMEIVEDRHGRGSLLITSQLPVTTWHEVIGEPTLGDAILDRIVHNAYRLELDGPLAALVGQQAPPARAAASAMGHSAARTGPSC